MLPRRFSVLPLVRGRWEGLGSSSLSLDFLFAFATLRAKPDALRRLCLPPQVQLHAE